MMHGFSPFRILAVVLALFCVTPAVARELVGKVVELDSLPPARPDLPVPHEPNQLFYLQRSKNANTVIYAANMAKPGLLDTKKPVEVYWRAYQYPDAPHEELSFIERTMVYGVSPKPVPGETNKYHARIGSYFDRDFIVDVDDKGMPEAVIEMDGHKAKLVSVYLQMDESGMLPKLVYGDIYGIDKESGRVLHEHLEPAKD